MSQNELLENELREQNEYIRAQEEKMRKMEIALKQIARGHHDPMPTRRLMQPDTEAASVDTWWQNYYTSNDERNKQIARDALGL